MLLLQVAADDLDAHTFVHNYLFPRRPVLIRGATSNWAWVEDWRKAVFMKRFGQERFSVTTVTSAVVGNGEKEFTLEKFMRETSTRKKAKKSKKSSDKTPGTIQAPDLAPSLLHSREAGDRTSRGFLTGLLAIPRFLGWQDDLTKAGVPFYRPPHWMDFTTGPAWSGLPPHLNDGHSWNALAFGARRWFLWPPGAQNGSLPLESWTTAVGADSSTVDGEWLSRTLPTMFREAQDHRQPALHLTQLAGDALFLPEGWISGFVNAQRSIGISEGLSMNLTPERAAAILADPYGHTLDKILNLIDD